MRIFEERYIQKQALCLRFVRLERFVLVGSAFMARTTSASMFSAPTRSSGPEVLALGQLVVMSPVKAVVVVVVVALATAAAAAAAPPAVCVTHSRRRSALPDDEFMCVCLSRGEST